MARAKGLSERTIVTKHAFRNALLPFITQLGMSLPWLIGGNVVIETIFAWPGIGQLAYDAARRADYTLLMGLVLFTGTLVILGNLLADVVCAIADPRVKYD
jgi:peptide/nickel transport system permease protein